MKTGEQSTEHPGIKYFVINRKAMRKKAEAKFKETISDRV